MFCIEKLDRARHDRNSFISTNPSFDDYLKKFANQDIKRNKTIVYVAVKPEDYVPKRIYGFYSINSFSLTDSDYSETTNLSFEPYGYISAILIGRLAIAKYQAQLRGFELLYQALRKCKILAQELGVSIILVEPIDERAIQFYKRQGFVNLGISSNFMYIPIEFVKEQYPAVSKMEITEEVLI